MIENNENTQEESGSVEKINLNELKTEQARIKFEETADKIINSPDTQRNALAYLKEHKEEYKEIFGHDLTITTKE